MQDSRRVEARVRLVLGRDPCGARLEEGRDADAAQLSFALRALAPRRKALPVGEQQSLVHDGLELAAVVGRAVRGLVGHRLRRNEIPPPQRDRVETVLGRGEIDEALDRAGDVGPSRAAVGRDRNGVRIGAARVRVHRRDPVHAAHGDGDVARADLRAERRGVGSEVGAIVEAQRQELSVAVERELSGERESAPVVVGQKDLRARRHPFHRAAELLRREHHRDVLGIGETADAEAPAHQLGDDADLLSGEAGGGGEKPAHAVQTLAGRIDGEDAARRIEAREEGARLDRIADQTLAAHREPRFQGRCGESGPHRGGVAGLVFEGEVAGDVLVQLRRARPRRRVETDRGGKIAILERDFLGGVLRERRALRDREGHGLADVVHLLVRERGPEGFFLLLASHALIRHSAGKRLPAGRRIVGAGEHEMHARPCGRGRDVGRDDLGVRAVGAQEKGVKLARKIPVRAVATLALEQARVFAAYRSFGHGSAGRCARKRRNCLKRRAACKPPRRVARFTRSQTAASALSLHWRD